jgi:peptide/nickel transport system substrate-binding protein
MAMVAFGGAGCVVGNPGQSLGGNQGYGQGDINPQPRSAIRDGGNLRIALQGFPANFNYLSVDGNEANNYSVTVGLLPSDYRSDAAGHIWVDHDYFSDIRLTGTNPQTVVWTINPKAVWSDGTPITWRDLAGQWHALSGQDPNYQIAANQGFDRVASVVEGGNDHQAVMTFTRPYSSWMSMYSPLYPAPVTATAAAFNSSIRDRMPLSAGPFKITDIDKVDGRLVLSRDPRWWGERAKLDTITYSVYDPSTWVAALANNEIDATEQAEPITTLSQVRQVRDASDVVLRHAPDPSEMVVTFNGAAGAVLADEKLRVAVAKAVNVPAIAKVGLFGLTDSPTQLSNHVYLLGQPGYQDNSDPLHYDQDAANHLLDALGWRRRGDWRYHDGRRLELRLAVTDEQSRMEIAQVIQQNLADAGIKVNIQPHPATGFFTDMIVNGNFDLSIFGWSGGPFPLQILDQVYAYDPGNPQSNYGHVGNSELNSLITDADAELDPQKVRQLANRIDREVYREGHSLTLFQNAGDYPVRANVANYGAFGLGVVIDFADIGFLK